MNKTFIILSICIMASMTGCGQDGNNFDLEKLEFPTAKDSIANKFNLSEGLDNFTFIIYDTKDKEAMYFDNLSLSGTLNKGETPFINMENYLTFFEDKKNSTIDAYQIIINTTNITLELEKLLEKKFGKADFDYKNDDFRFRIWESENKAYFFEVKYTGQYNGKNYTASYLYVVNKNNEVLYRWIMAGGFQYYADYLDEKNKDEHKNQPYSYKDFVIQQEKEYGAENYYVKDYVK